MVIQNMVPHKLISRFNKAEYNVMEKKRNELILNGDGKTIRRHVTQVKKIPNKIIKGDGSRPGEVSQDIIKTDKHI